MLPLAKPKELPTLSTQSSKDISKTLKETKFEIQHTEIIAGPVPIVLSDWDSPTMTVCRVCLTMKVKMHQLLEPRLKDMYKRVTGIEINTEDNLPHVLCWECVARLSSANRFIEKALKSHWILMKKNKSGRCITIKDIKAIDAAQNKLESTLGTKHYKVNHSDFHIIKETAEIGNIYEFHNEIIVKTVKNNRYDGENDFGSTDDEEEQIYVNHVDTSEEKDPIKTEQVDIDEKEEATDNIHVINSYKADINNVKYESEDAGISNEEFVISIKEENMCDDKLAVCNADESREVCKVTDRKLKRRNDSPTPPRNRSFLSNQLKTGKNIPYTCQGVKLNRRSITLSRCKELKVVLEDIMLSKFNTQYPGKLLTANAASTKENKNNILETFHSTFGSTDVKEAAENKITRTVNLSVNEHGITNQIINTRTNIVNINNSLMLNDNENVKKLFICDTCNKPFRRKTTLVRHVMKHPKLYDCTYCNYKTYHKGNFGQHVNSKHTKRTVFNCSYCSFEAYRKTHVNQHINSQHTKTNVFNCSYCCYKAYVKIDLDRHINSKHTKKTVFNCSHCSYKAYVKAHLDRHINCKHTKNTVFNCSYCHFKAYAKNNLKRHINCRHTKTTVFNCSYCSYKSYDRVLLDQHINSRHTKNTVFNCSYCSYKAYRKSNLDRHINSNHTKKTVFNCSFCSFKTYEKVCLNRHVNYKHTKNTVFNCPDCSYKSYRKNHLNQHINSKHTKSIVFNCSDCSYRTYNKGNLDRHINSKHTK